MTKSTTEASSTEVATSDTLDFELVIVPPPIAHKTSKVAEAMERLAAAPKMILDGVPAEVLDATRTTGVEKFDMEGVWKPAVYFVYGWVLCRACDHEFETIEGVHRTGMLPDEDFDILVRGQERFVAANGEYLTPITGNEVVDIRRALANVNRVILRQETVSREMVAERRAQQEAERSAKKLATKPASPPAKKPTLTKRPNTKDTPKPGANELLVALVEAWKNFMFDQTASNRELLKKALLPCMGSRLGDMIRDEMNRRGLR